ncbi:peroxiredoxin family protein [Oceanobacillus luteolus]|uniref:Peroxiredoxin family protein n=1 Tax=Oceanobacillus luteolus TaxID=1274358 RepID=A0ABW4HQQ0_9BACI
MKKWILIMVVLGMLGWAVFDFINSENPSPNQMTDAEEVQETEGDERQEATEKEIPVGLEVGNRAPDFQLQTLAGESVKLSDFRGSRVMINFWATWCPPCRAEMPDMEKFYQDKDIVVLAVNLTDTENSLEDVKEFSDEYGLTFPILLDTDLETASLYSIQPLPTSYMVDSNGIIRNMAFGALNYDLMVQEFERMQ